jgi:hypothetical protein
MDARWVVLIAGASVGALITWQTMFSTKVSTVYMVLRLVLFAAEAVLVMAVGRPHPNATNSFPHIRHRQSCPALPGGFFVPI